MRSLLLDNVTYSREYDHLLGQQGWQAGDVYLCVFFRAIAGQTPGVNVNYDAFYLRDLFDSHYILVHDASIYQVINISKSQYSSEDLKRCLKLFLNNNNYIAGLSIEFEDFAHVWMYMQQAMTAAEYHEPTADSCIFQFEKNVLYILLQNAKNGYASEFYLTNPLRRLFQYDRKNHADLVKTLQVYLENNLSVPRTQEQLHIARTTCLYRIQRIENISRLNLKHPDTQLYLLLLFRLMDI